MRADATLASSAVPPTNTISAKVRVPASLADATPAALFVLGDWFCKDDARSRASARHHPKVGAAVESSSSGCSSPARAADRVRDREVVVIARDGPLLEAATAEGLAVAGLP
jgi:hypothetical protein